MTEYATNKQFLFHIKLSFIIKNGMILNYWYQKY